MARKILGGVQDFAELRQGGYFYIDKTAFIREWWDGSDGSDKVTLITRPRRFGKTLMLSTVRYFFSEEYASRSDLFEGLEIWKDMKMRALHGTYPVIFLSWADVKNVDFASLKGQIIQDLAEICADYAYLNSPEFLYDVMLEPRNPQKDPAFILEFKVHESDLEADLKATVATALEQIDKNGYAQSLLDRGIAKENIHKYGFAFKGKKVLIG